MLIQPLPARYLVGAAIWLLLLVGLLTGLVWLRRLAVCLTGLELAFAAFVSESDALNFTNVARRWHETNIAPQVNELGLRSRHPPATTLTSARQRIAFVGDSFTFGHGVPRLEDRFSDRVEVALELAHPGRYAVDNFGVPGHDVTAVAAQVAALFAHGYRPRLVIYVWQLNDLERLDDRTWAAVSGFTAARGGNWLLRQTYFFDWLFHRVRLGGGAVATYFDDLRAAYDGPAFPRAEAVLDGLQAQCREHGAELRLVVFPFLHDLGPGYGWRAAHARLAAHARSRGLRLLDLEPVLSPHAGEDLIVNPRDTHPNERAHELAALAMQARLLEDLLAADTGR